MSTIWLPILLCAVVVSATIYEIFRSTFLLRRCAWCQKFMGLKLAHGTRLGRVSHGICQKCVHRMVA